jgi:hypothetical protein
MESVYGKDRADMLTVLGYQDLLGEIKQLNADGHSDWTRLHPDLKGVDPDEYYNQVPYEKGAAFLRLLEAKFGRKKFDAYLKGYFQRYAFKSMTTDAFLEDLREHLLHNDDDMEKSLKVHAWLYDKGLPDNLVPPTSPVFEMVADTAKAFLGGQDPKTLDVAGYSTQHWQYFLSQMPDGLTPDQMAALDNTFQFTRTHNSEILFAWLQLAIRHHYLPAMPALHDFLLSQGRMKFCTPLYRSLMAQPGWGVDMARRIYAEAKPGYHELTRASVENVVK